MLLDVIHSICLIYFCVFRLISKFGLKIVSRGRSLWCVRTRGTYDDYQGGGGGGGGGGVECGSGQLQ